MKNNNIYIIEDLLPKFLVSGCRNSGVLERLKVYRDFMKKPKSLPELFELNQLCYFMVRNSIMSENRLTHNERKKFILPLSERWANRIFCEGKYDSPIWIDIVYEIFEAKFDNTEAFELLKKLKINIEYSKIPTVRVSDTDIFISIALFPFLLQLNCTYLFSVKIEDDTDRENEIRQKILPLLVFQSNPVETSISGLPVIYGLEHSEVEFANILTMFQIIFIILHEMGHLDRGHVPGIESKLKVNSEHGTKEIEADIFAYTIFEKIEGDDQITIGSAIVSLLSYYTLIEEFKNKLRKREHSVNLEVFEDRLHLSEIFLRGAISDYYPDDIDKTQFDVVEKTAKNCVGYALYPLGIIQQTIRKMSTEELLEFSFHFTNEGISKHQKENGNESNNN